MCEGWICIWSQLELLRLFHYSMYFSIQIDWRPMLDLIQFEKVENFGTPKSSKNMTHNLEYAE